MIDDGITDSTGDNLSDRPRLTVLLMRMKVMNEVQRGKNGEN